MTNRRNISGAVAVALRFNSNSDRAPRLAEVGIQQRAQTIVQLARRYGIPLTEDQDLACELAELPEQAEVPEDLYAEIAALFAELKAC